MNVIYPNEYPALLRQIPSVPSQLYFEGNISLLYRRCITIVGTRAITDYGITVIDSFLDTFLSDLNIVVVSGLARGVDGYVHRVCLERGIDTISIVPGSLESVIPKENREIYREIAKKGLLISEFPLGVTFRREMFVLRNRLLAGISDFTLVIEAGKESGSLITAGLAGECNRDVYVVPGSIFSSTSEGCNLLARQGAGIVASLDDFKELFGIYGEQITI